jgi:hypothetical protein
MRMRPRKQAAFVVRSVITEGGKLLHVGPSSHTSIIVAIALVVDLRLFVCPPRYPLLTAKVIRRMGAQIRVCIRTADCHMKCSAPSIALMTSSTRR